MYVELAKLEQGNYENFTKEMNHMLVKVINLDNTDSRLLGEPCNELRAGMSITLILGAYVLLSKKKDKRIG